MAGFAVIIAHETGGHKKRLKTTFNACNDKAIMHIIMT